MNEILCPQTNQYSLRNDRDFNLPQVALKVQVNSRNYYGIFNAKMW